MLLFETETKELQSKSSTIRNTNESNIHFELNENKKFSIRTILIVMNVLSFIFCFLIMKNFSYYFNKKYEFNYYKALLFYIILYSFGLCFTFILGLFISFIIIICSSFKKSIKKRRKNSFNKYEENSFAFLCKNSNEKFLLPYTLTFFILFTIILYLFAFPYSLFLFVTLKKNTAYLQFNEFKLLYSFISINALAGLILLYALNKDFKKKEPNEKEDFDLEGSDFENFRNEIRRALKKVKE